MFISREYAACVLVVFILAALLLVARGIGGLLKATGIIFVWVLPAVAYRMPTLKRMAMRFSSRNVICTGAEPTMIADCAS
jgi:hypothetical protein